MAYSEYLNREHEARNRAIADFRAILDTADAEKRDLSAEEMEQVEKFEAEVDTRDTRITKLAKMSAAAERTAEVANQLGAAVGRTETTMSNDTRLIVAIREAGSRLSEGFSTDRALDLVIDLEKRAIADFSDNGALYTTDFATQIAIYQRTVSPWINLASVINADNGRPLNLPRLTADPTTYKPGEGTAITESTPTIGSAALTTAAYKALSYVSAEAEQDELIGLLPIIARVQGRALGLAFGPTSRRRSCWRNERRHRDWRAAPAPRQRRSLATTSSSIPRFHIGVGLGDVNGMISRHAQRRPGQYLWQPSIAAGQPPVRWRPGTRTPSRPLGNAVSFHSDASAVVIKQMARGRLTDFKFDTDQVAIVGTVPVGSSRHRRAQVRDG
jgi:hypothetical protein